VHKVIPELVDLFCVLGTNEFYIFNPVPYSWIVIILKVFDDFILFMYLPNLVFFFRATAPGEPGGPHSGGF
jgi:hypothetical protein